MEGKCGVCGDYYNGFWYNEVLNGKYVFIWYFIYVFWEGLVINVIVEVFENGNGGYFMFKLCDLDDV